MPCYKPLILAPHGIGTVVPCGKCIGCRLEYARQWAIRCQNEASCYEFNQFLTLTYRDENLVYSVKSKLPHLYPPHLTNFWKRLRNEFDGIRYFACGEYGDTTHRPHYHACVFNFDCPGKELLKVKNGNRIYRSDLLDRIWGHGHVAIGDVTFQSASYVARYVMKKKLGKSKEFYEDNGIEPEFSRCSRRPGIGLPWIERFSGDVYYHGFMVINGKRVAPPKYYMRKFKENEPAEMDERAKQAMIEQQADPNFLCYPQYKIRAIHKEAQIRSLTRGGI